MTPDIVAIPDIPETLREAAQLGKLVPFVRAGASKLAGCPDWDEFANGALRLFVDHGKFSHAQLDQIRPLRPRIKLSIALALQAESKIPIDFRALLHRQERREHASGRRLYSHLSKLGRTFVTTNYDEWLDDELPPPTPNLSGDAAASEESAPTPRRVYIEDAQHVHPADISRFGKLGVIARLGARPAEEGAYVWQKLMQTGAVVTNGTDAPVEDVGPIASFYATVTRKLASGEVFYPEQRMSRIDALKSYTIKGPYAAFQDDTRGSLRKGKYADMVVLSKDIMTVPDDKIPTAQVVYTIVGGKIRYSRES